MTYYANPTCENKIVFTGFAACYELPDVIRSRSREDEHPAERERELIPDTIRMKVQWKESHHVELAHARARSISKEANEKGIVMTALPREGT